MKFTALLALPLAVTLAYAQTNRQTNGEAADVRVNMKSAQGQNAGTATITETPHGLLVRYTPFNIPAGTHAIHLHEAGMCAAPGFDSAGGHFNPTKTAHGFASVNGYHAGDMPNIDVSSERGTHELFVRDVTLRTGKMPLIDANGAALVVHAGVDDHASDPAGDAGDRIACGVIQKSTVD